MSSLEKVLTNVTAEKEKYKLIVEGSQLELKQQLEVSHKAGGRSGSDIHISTVYSKQLYLCA